MTTVPTATDHVLAEIRKERKAQDAKWGEQNHLLVDQTLIGRPTERMADEYEIPTATRARVLCQRAAALGAVTWGHILVEEVAEFICADPADELAMRAELIQVAAVAVAAIESIDRRIPF